MGHRHSQAPPRQGGLQEARGLPAEEGRQGFSRWSGQRRGVRIEGTARAKAQRHETGAH